MRVHCKSCGDFLGRHEPYSTALRETRYDPAEYCVDCLGELEQGSVPSLVGPRIPSSASRRRRKSGGRV